METKTATSEEQSMELKKKVLVGVVGGFSLLYLLNPTMGFDLIPDNLPVIGNLDEAAVTAILLSCLAYFGLDVRKYVDKVVHPDSADGKPNGVIDIDADVRDSDRKA
ncbi:MAG: YkvA family protein [Verrucomicrobiota bacterium]